MSDARLTFRETAELMEGMVKGQTEPVPLSGEDYLLQVIVSLHKEEVEVDSQRRTYKLKRSGELLLTRIPKQNEGQLLSS
jgi:hypothetical protein